MNKEKIDAFWRRRTNIADPQRATHFFDGGRLTYELDFVRRHLPDNPRILDLGAGTCQVSAPLLDVAREITAVEKFGGFLDMVPEHPRLTKVCEDVTTFSAVERFDVILLFGIVTYLSAQEEVAVYERCAGMLGERGCCLVKNQCGVSTEVVVDAYSEELLADYHARYPAFEEQRRRLTDHFDVRVVDVYPPELNRWNNTHVYGFACTKRAA
jgi:hypothetical protein